MAASNREAGVSVVVQFRSPVRGAYAVLDGLTLPVRWHHDPETGREIALLVDVAESSGLVLTFSQPGPPDDA